VASLSKSLASSSLSAPNWSTNHSPPRPRFLDQNPAPIRTSNRWTPTVQRYLLSASLTNLAEVAAASPALDLTDMPLPQRHTRRAGAANSKK
jgi:hypothetical protein